MQNNNDVSFWYDDHTILFSSEYLIDFFPSSAFTLNRKLNAIFRASIYISVLLSVYSNNPKWVVVLIIGALVTLMLRRNGNKTKIEGLENTTFNKGVCTEPTVDNPFMNYTMGDFMNVDENLRIRDKPVACSVIDNPSVKELSETAYQNNLFRDVNDVYKRSNNSRQFHTTPNTNIVSDQDTFANWLYKTPETCKENTEHCVPYEDLRAKRPIQVESNVNPVNTEARMS